MTNRNMRALAALTLAAALASCGASQAKDQQSNATDSAKNSAIGSFSPDSAYSYIENQVAFGPRVPGSEGHDKCRDYIVESLNRFGADTVIVQEAEVEAFNGDKLPIANIVARYKSNNAKRILLVAHYDTRPWADMESKSEERSKPIPGANDGASGVGVLLEIARNLALKQPSVGVDLLFVDAEDYGNNDGFATRSDSWCLGSQYWTENMVPYTDGNLPVYGILLDMVGGRNARFHYEAFATKQAKTPTIKVWSEAEQLGYGDRFIRTVGGAVTDDHIFLTRAGIPTTDIIELNNEETSTFPPTWHTLNDDMSNIDRSTLKAVGETVLNVVYKEKPY